MRRIRILGTGKYLPAHRVLAAEIDQHLGLPPGWTVSKTAVQERRFASEGETTAWMGAKAAEAALQDAGLTFADIDCLVCTSSVGHQPIPCTAALIQEALGQANSGTPCFDVNATCLSFLAGLDLLSYLIAAGRYRRVLLVAAEIASVGLNASQPESYALFGDGAAAVVIGPSSPDEPSQLVTARLETYSSGAHFSEIRGGGSAYHPRHYSAATDAEFLFDMNGPGIYRLASRYLPAFIKKLLAEAGTQMADLALVIPHQASSAAMRLMQRKLGIADHQLMSIVETHGNTIAASIPMTLHEAIKQGRMRRSDRVLLMGTAAGLTLGGIVLDY